MPQTLYHASGLTADNADKLKDAGMNVPGVKWVNINNGNVVVTHDDSFDADAFAAALHGTDGSVSLGAKRRLLKNAASGCVFFVRCGGMPSCVFRQAFCARHAASAAMCSGPTPQQPPMMSAPAARQRFAQSR